MKMPDRDTGNSWYLKDRICKKKCLPENVGKSRVDIPKAAVSNGAAIAYHIVLS